MRTSRAVQAAGAALRRAAGFPAADGQAKAEAPAAAESAGAPGTAGSGGTTGSSSQTVEPAGAAAAPVAAGAAPAGRTTLLWATAAAGLAVDQSTKAIAAVAVEGHDPVHAFGGAVTFTALRNSGAAGSFAPHATLVFTCLAIGVLAFVFRVARSVQRPGWAVGLGLIFAGAGGNLTDRLFRTPGFGRGAVLDFIQVGHSGVFNLADQCVTAGAAVVLVQAMRGVPMRAKSPEFGHP